MNAYAERWVRSLRQECLRRVVPLGKRHLRKLVAEYAEHYHLERNHQAGWLDLVSKVTGHRLRVEDTPAEEGEELSFELEHESVAHPAP